MSFKTVEIKVTKGITIIINRVFFPWVNITFYVYIMFYNRHLFT